MAKVIVELTALTSGFTAGFNEARRGLNSLANAFGPLGSIINRFGAQLAIVLGPAALGRFAKQSIDTADATSKMAQQIGVSTEFLSTFNHAAELAGVGVDGLRTAFKTFAQYAEQASEGLATPKRLFDQLGISVTDQEGRLKSVQQLLLEVADAYRGMADGTAKAASAGQLFGRSGMALIPLLNSGADGIREMQDEARALGLEIGTEFGVNAERFNDSITRLQGGLRGVANVVSAALLPDLDAFTESLVQVTKESNSAQTGGNALVTTIRGLVTAFDFAWQAANLVAEVIANALVGAMELLNLSFQAGIKLTGLLFDSVTSLAKAFADLALRAARAATIVQLLSTGNIAGAIDAAKDSVNGLGADLVALTDHIGDNVKAAVGTVTKFTGDTTRMAAGMAGDLLDQVEARAQGLSLRMLNRFGPAGGGATPAGSARPGPAGGGAAGPSEQAASMSAQLNSQFEQGMARLFGGPGDAALVAEDQAQQARLDKIAELVASEDEKNQLIELAEGIHQQKLVEIEDAAAEQRLRISQREEAGKRRLRDMQLAGVYDMFGNMGTAARAFGRTGFEIWKKMASAQALIDTYKAAQGAYSSVVGIPYVGPVLAVVAAAAAVAAGIANVAQINAQSFASGGLIPGGPQMINVNEFGTEGVVNAAGMRNIGVAGLEAINSGLVNAANLASSVPAGLASNIGGAAGGSSFGPAGNGGGGGENITVIVVDNRPQGLALMQSIAGRKIITDAVIAGKTEIGIPT